MILRFTVVRCPDDFHLRLPGYLGRSATETRHQVDWYNATGSYHEKTFPHDGRLASLPEEWQRELAAIWRLEADVNNGGYLQFLANWGRESYTYATRCLKRIGATAMAKLIDNCQVLVDEHYDTIGKSQADLQQLMPNEMIDMDGNVTKERGSVLPDSVIERIMDLSYEFMDYPDDIATLGLAQFRQYLESEIVAEPSDEREPE